MSDAETRALGRAATLLLLTSVLRWAWGTARPPGPPTDDAAPTALLEESRALARDADVRSRPLARGERLDPNRATAQDLDRLPGVGPTAAAALVRSRAEDGPFLTAADLSRVPGIGPATVSRIAPFLDLPAPPAPPPRGPQRRGTAGRPPVDLNRAAAAELQTLPGVGPALARRIVETRAAGPFRTVDELVRVPGIGPATLARLRSLVRVGG